MLIESIDAGCPGPSAMLTLHPAGEEEDKASILELGELSPTEARIGKAAESGEVVDLKTVDGREREVRAEALAQLLLVPRGPGQGGPASGASPRSAVPRTP